jgi:hypothetical protein
MPRYPLILDNAGLPPTWELVTALPSGNYKLALNARGAEFVCDGAGTISVPPRQLGVYLDCRADPTGPPPGETRALYIAGNLEVK